MKNTKIIAAFHECGKTYYFKNKEENISVLDSDSSKFSWMEVIDQEYEIKNRGKTNYQQRYIKVRNPDFPQNYINYIKENIGKVDYILVSTHEEVRKALNDAEIDFCLVYPKRSLKAEWVGRCFLRGSDEKFCQLIADKWDEWISQLEAEDNDCYVLNHNEYLSDAIQWCIV